MSLFDRLRRGARPEPQPPVDVEGGGMSRRDFFARLARRESGDESAGEAAPAARDDGVLHTFTVKSFPYHDGPVLVPILRAGDEYKLAPDPPYSADPKAVRIERGRDLLGFVPDAYVTEILGMLKERVPLVCRAVRVDPAAALSNVLTVEIVRPTPERAGELDARHRDAGASPDDPSSPTDETPAGSSEGRTESSSS